MCQMSLLSSIFTLMTPFPVLHHHFSWLHYCAYWGCMSWLISDSFLTHIVPHAGRIFWQWHHNCIICLVIESALHVYKASSVHHWDNSHIMGIHHQYSSDSTQLQSKYSLSAWPPDLECQKLSDFWSQTYVIIAYIINFQVQSSPGKIHLGFTMGILRVQFSNTVPLPINTITVVGEDMIPYMFGYGVIPKNIEFLHCPSSHQPQQVVSVSPPRCCSHASMNADSACGCQSMCLSLMYCIAATLGGYGW